MGCIVSSESSPTHAFKPLETAEGSFTGSSHSFRALGVSLFNQPTGKQLRQVWFESDLDQNDVIDSKEFNNFLRKVAKNWGCVDTIDINVFKHLLDQPSIQWEQVRSLLWPPNQTVHFCSSGEPKLKQSPSPPTSPNFLPRRPQASSPRTIENHPRPKTCPSYRCYIPFRKPLPRRVAQMPSHPRHPDRLVPTVTSWG